MRCAMLNLKIESVMADFGSRKFLVTMFVIASTVGLAAFGKVDANVALIFGACVTAYNWANVKAATS